MAGVRVRWRSTGMGPPLVLVHGLAGSWRWWRPVLPALAAEHTVHLLDLPGFGRIPQARVFQLDRALDWLAAWARAATLGPADIVGHSLGAVICARLAARHSETVRRLVLVAPAGVPGRTAAGSALPLALELLRSRPRLLALLARDSLRSGPLTIGTAALAVVGADLRSDLLRVEAPTLVLMGGRDVLVPAWHGEELARALADARVVVLDGAGHVPMIDAPDAFSRELLAFLGSD
ncbi:MAG: alpha/beta fold hydrolase [Gaiellaceae bacterium MAG52_C11]|nr:alpha/beta fold hydrolase [Candidatus Gaiellasilicea maunaloa]